MKGVRSIMMIGLMLIAVSLSAASLSDVEKRISEKAKIEDLQLRQSDNVVILEGRASSLRDKLEAEKIAAKEIQSAMLSRIALPVTQKSDEEINLEIASRLRHKSARSNIFNSISVRTLDGNVFLSGSVRDAILSRQAEEAAQETPGVRSVSNAIKVLAPSISDDRLRLTIYRRVANEFLGGYFHGATPSVSIIVDFSRVTLTGYVNSNIDRVRMASIIRHIPGVLSVNNQLQVDRG